MAVTANPTLQTEIAYFESQRAQLLQNHEGQFALVTGQRIVGTFTTEEEAYEAGLHELGNNPFLIRRVRQPDAALTSNL